MNMEGVSPGDLVSLSLVGVAVRGGGEEGKETWLIGDTRDR